MYILTGIHGSHVAIGVVGLVSIAVCVSRTSAVNGAPGAVGSGIQLYLWVVVVGLTLSLTMVVVSASLMVSVTARCLLFLGHLLVGEGLPGGLRAALGLIELVSSVWRCSNSPSTA